MPPLVIAIFLHTSTRTRLPTPAGMLHPSINLENPESGIDLKRVCAGVKQQHKVSREALASGVAFT
jgi:hypothetical protein